MDARARPRAAPKHGEAAQTPRRGRFNSFDRADRTPRGKAATPQAATRRAARAAGTPRGANVTPRAKRPTITTAAAWAKAAGLAPVKSAAKSVTSQELGRKCAAQLRERGVDGQVHNVCALPREHLPGADDVYRGEYVASVLDEVLQRTQSDRSRAAQCIALLCDESLLSTGHVATGMRSVLDVIDDLAIDVPQVRDHVAKMIQQLSLCGALEVSQLPTKHAAIWTANVHNVK